MCRIPTHPHQRLLRLHHDFTYRSGNFGGGAGSLSDVAFSSLIATRVVAVDIRAMVGHRGYLSVSVLLISLSANIDDSDEIRELKAASLVNLLPPLKFEVIFRPVC